MLLLSDSVAQSLASLRAHKLRSALTMVGLTMGVATLITVMTIVQGANLYVEQKIANLGTNVFQVARTPFAATDFSLIIKAQKHRKFERDDLEYVRANCQTCELIGATGSTTARVKYADRDLADVTVNGHTASMGGIDTREVISGRYFTENEEQHDAAVCLIGQGIVDQFFAGTNAIGRVIRIQNIEYTVVGTFERIGSVLGQDQDTFVVIPLGAFLRMRPHFSLTLNVLAKPGEQMFDKAQDEVTIALRAKRHVAPGKESDFFIGTKESYISLWQSISGAFFAVFVMVSSISAIVGGIVIMNVMLVSVTERTKEIGVRRALGATKGDIARQFLTESVIQCLVGGLIGVLGGFGVATVLKAATSFPAAVQTWVAVLGMVMSSLIGLFFGIYPAMRASGLDPVVALRAE